SHSLKKEDAELSSAKRDIKVSMPGSLITTHRSFWRPLARSKAGCKRRMPVSFVVTAIRPISLAERRRGDLMSRWWRCLEDGPERISKFDCMNASIAFSCDEWIEWCAFRKASRSKCAGRECRLRK